MMNNKIKIGIGVGVAALIAAGGSYYYLNVSAKSPERTIEIVEQSITNHNKQDFYKFVDLDGVLDSSYDGIVDGLTDSDKGMTEDAREAVKNFTQMLKSPLLLTLHSAIDSYVEKGDFNAEENVGLKELISRIGIDRIEYRGVESVNISPNKDNEATAKVKIFQPELGGEFTMDVALAKNNEGEWQVVGLKNFNEFVAQINKVRRANLDKYLERIEDINTRHDTTIRESEQRYSSILSLGSLGQENTRSELRSLMLDVVKKDWESRKQELFDLQVPPGAETLQNVLLKICDLEISYADEYAQWMTDKKAATIKSAEEKHRQAQILRAESLTLARRMS